MTSGRYAMKVLWLGHNLAYPPKGGALQRNYNLLREIARRCEVHVLAFDQPATRPANVTPQDCLGALGEFCASAEWVPLTSSFCGGNRYALALKGLVSGEPYDFAWLRSEQMADRLQSIVKSVAPDVVHVDALGLAQYFPLVAQAGTVLNHHDVESSKLEVRARKATNPVLQRYFAWESKKLAAAERKWCPCFAVNTVVSDEEGGVLSRSSPLVRIKVVPNGVDTKYFTPRTDPGGHLVLFCGSLDMHPNQEAVKFLLERIWPRVLDEIPDAVLYVVGRKPPHWLEEVGRADSRVRVTGFVDDVRPYFEKAAVCVCPILSGGGTRLKILDSLAMGVPVVATPFAASGLSLEHGRHLLLADTPEKFVDETLRLLRSPSLRAELSGAGTACVDRAYSWSVVGRALLDAYEIALHNRTAIVSLS